MLESGTWQIATLDTDNKEDVTWEYKYAPMPKGEEQATVIGGENFGVCSGSENVEECAEFLKYMQSAQNTADWCEIAGKLPVRADAVELKDFWTADERYKVFNDSMEFAVARGPHESWPTISEALYKAEQAALLGDKDPAEALKEADYTADSWKAMQTALTEAKSALEAKESQEKVNAAEAKLTKAIEDLKKNAVAKEVYVLMNIPYDKFYAAEGDDDVDAVTSATKQKTRNSGLTAGSYHVNSDGTDITGVVYPVKVSDISALLDQPK